MRRIAALAAVLVAVVPLRARAEDDEQPSTLAHVEFGLVTGVSGSIAALGLSGLHDGNPDRAILPAGLVGGVIGAGLGFGLELRPGTELLFEAGPGWGAWLGAMWALRTRGASSSRTLFGSMLGGQLLGYGLAAGIEWLAAPPAGQVSLVTSAGLAATLGTVLVSQMRQDASGTISAQWVVAAGGAGLLLGGLLAHVWPVSRERVLSIDLSAVLGLAAGALVAEGLGASPRGTAGLLGAGFVAGLAAGVVLPPLFGVEDPPLRLVALPSVGGATVLASTAL